MGTSAKKIKRNDEAIMNLGRNIRKFRKLKGLTIAQLAYACEIEPKQLYNYEYGKVDTNITNLTLIAEHLGVEAYQLLMKHEE